MKIVTIVGARPQFIKAATVSRVLRAGDAIREVLVHTGQHYDTNMSEIFFTELEIPRPDYNLGIGSGSHGAQTGRMLQGIEEVLLKEKPDITLIYGDTNSTVAGALASVKLHIPVAHVEAGLRSFNREMPEEINRIVADRISDLLFAPTQTAVAQLQQEGLAGNTLFSGDVMYDSVLFYRNRSEGNGSFPELAGIPGRYLLATIHRAENTDNHDNFRNILLGLAGAPLPVVLPIHPRTRKILSQGFDLPANLLLIDPVGYLPMLKLVNGSTKVLTDSGGLQKEAYFLGKPCITLRTETEWVETLHDGWNVITGTKPSAILDAIHSPMPTALRKDEFGDGHAAEIIAGHLSRFSR